MQASSSLLDLTQGRPAARILRFACPLILGSLFQQLYNFVDTVFVGRFLGEDALAAVGLNYSLNFLVVGFVQGMCVGFGVLLAQSFGAKDARRLNAFFWNGALLCTALAAALAVGMVLGSRPLLRAIQTPEQLFPLASAYIRVIFAGIPATMLYNYTASALRAVGDSRHPFYFLLISSALNVALDYLFLVPLGLGVAGAAAATVLSQLLSGVLNCAWLLLRTGVFQRPKAALLSLRCMGQLCGIGFPMGFQQSISGIGMVFLQSAVNSLGAVAVTAQAVGEKIRGLFTQPIVDLGAAISTYTGQNYGAQKPERIRQGVWSGLLIQGVYCAAVWLFLFFFKGSLIGLIMGGTGGPAAQGAAQYLAVLSPLFLLLGALVVFRNLLQGLGHSVLAAVSGVVELCTRYLVSTLAVPAFGFNAVCAANPCSWGSAMVYCILMAWYVGTKKRAGAAQK